MIAVRAIKSLLAITASGAVFAGLVALLAAAVLVLFVIPGGLGILTIEWERAKSWLGRARAFLLGKNPPPKQQSL
jgi:hypothetical protein